MGRGGGRLTGREGVVSIERSASGLEPRLATPSRPVTVVGVDPGSRNTGVAVRRLDQLLWGALERRGDLGALPGPDYLVEVLTTVERALEIGAEVTTGDVLLCVEAVTPPNPHLGITNTTGVLGTAMVVGALLGYFEEVLLVPTGAHGSGPREAYPPGLWGVRERTGGGRYRHVRSAWDIAGAGAIQARFL